MNAQLTLGNVACARFPAASLVALAGLRRFEGISVLLDGERSWVFWEGEDVRVVEAIFPIEGIELFERRGESWYRFGQHLPCFEVPDSSPAVPIDRAIFPATFAVVEPGETSPIPSSIRLVRDGTQRPSTAALCPLNELGRWAETAPAREIESFRGAVRGDEALLLGRGLPPWPGSTKYWGERVLIPIGFQVRPALPEEAMLEALGSSGLEVFRFEEKGSDQASTVEAIPFDAFRPLTRAGVRLAVRARSS